MMGLFALRPKVALLLLLSALVSACVAHEVRQLDQFKEWAKAGNQAAIVEKTVDCQAGAPGCDQLYLIHGLACYHQARTESEAPRVRGLYECAIEDLTQGMSLAGSEAPTKEKTAAYAAALLEAIRERHDLATSWSEATRYRELLLGRAERYRRTYPEQPEGYYYGAVAGFAEASQQLVQGGPGEDVCQLLGEARALLEIGDNHPGKLKNNFRATLREVRKTMQEECLP